MPRVMPRMISQANGTDARSRLSLTMLTHSASRICSRVSALWTMRRDACPMAGLMTHRTHHRICHGGRVRPVARQRSEMFWYGNQNEMTG